MARSDLLLGLVRAGNRGDQELFRRAVEALIADERGKHHHILAERLSQLMVENGRTRAARPAPPDSATQDTLFELTPRVRLDDLILPAPVRRACDELVEEQMRADLLRSHALEPRHRVLLAGPPGNGKTTLAEALADALAVPFFVVRYEGIIGSFLGETATRLRRTLEYVHTRRCLLFFDEFDAIGKERGDTHETGEIKRVVSSLLLQLDALPSYVTVVTASNHPELLDRAVWRRFQLRLYLPPPTRAERTEWFARLETRLGESLGVTPATLASRLGSASFAELEDFELDVMRQRVLHPETTARQVVRDRLQQWVVRFEPSARTV